LITLSLCAIKWPTVSTATSYKQRAHAKPRKKKKIEVYRESDRAEVPQHTSIHYAVYGEEKEKCSSKRGKKELS